MNNQISNSFIYGKTNWKYILIVVILAIIVGGGTLELIKKQEISPAKFPEITKPTTRTRKLSTIPDWAETIPYLYNDKVKNIHFSSDGRKVAYVVKKGEQEALIINGEVSEFYNWISPLIFSPDNQRVGYIIKKGRKYFVVIDGKENKGDGYDEVDDYTLKFSPDNKHFIYRASNFVNKGWDYFVVYDGKEGKHYRKEGARTWFGHVVFSPDSDQFAYVVRGRSDKKEFIVVNDREGKPYDSIDDSAGFSFTLDNKLVYLVRDEHKWFLVIDGEEQDVFNSAISDFEFSPDYQRIAYIFSSNVIVDGKKEKKYEMVKSFSFSPDSKHYAYIARDEKGFLVVYDGKESKARYEYIHSLTFSPDSRQVVFYASRGGGWTHLIYVGGEDFLVFFDGENEKESEPYISLSSRGRGSHDDPIQDFIFSPDSKHFGYRVDYQGPERKWFIVIDGEKGKPYDLITEGPIFSPDSNHFAFVAKKEGKEIIVTDNKEGKPYDKIYNVAFSPDSKYVYYGARLGNELWWIVDEIE